MTIMVIEATSEQQRAEYKKTAEYADFIAGAKSVTDGVTLDARDYDEATDKEVPVDIFWILIENDEAEDNATYRVTAENKVVYWASGVEV